MTALPYFLAPYEEKPWKAGTCGRCDCCHDFTAQQWHCCRSCFFTLCGRCAVSKTSSNPGHSMNIAPLTELRESGRTKNATPQWVINADCYERANHTIESPCGCRTCFGYTPSVLARRSATLEWHSIRDVSLSDLESGSLARACPQKLPDGTRVTLGISSTSFSFGLRKPLPGETELKDLKVSTRMGYAEAWARLNTAEAMDTHLDSPGVISKIQKWIHDCETLHDNEHCRQAAKTVLPSRLIAVGSLDEPVLRLEQTSGRTGKYIALSHCWGGFKDGQTLQSNLAARLHTIDDSELPKTFQDAIRCARRLRVAHLWIDSLCIIQDSASDWESESAQMCDVYSNAYFVLVASSAIADNVGLLNEVPEQYRGISLESAPGSGCYDMVVQQQIPHATGPAGVVGSAAPVAAINIGPLETRAWCFQETLLARRSIGFTANEIAFECHDHVECECNSSNRTDGAGIDVQGAKTIEQQWMYVAAEDLDGGNSEKHLWRRPLSQITDVDTLYMEGRRMIVPNYTSRQLTFASDKLPALSGIAALTLRLCQDQYVAGMWRADLHRGLLWRADQWTGSLPGPGPLLFCQHHPAGPSFSWASVDGSIVYNVPEDALGDVRLEIIDCQVQLAGEQKNRFGACSGAWMRIRGRSFQFHLQGRCVRDGSSDGYTLNPAWSKGGMEHTEFDPDCLLCEVSTQSEM